MIQISWPQTSWNCLWRPCPCIHPAPRRFDPIKRLSLSFTSPRLLFFSFLHLSGTLECSLSVEGHRLLPRVSPVLSCRKKKKKQVYFLTKQVWKDRKPDDRFRRPIKPLQRTQRRHTFTFRVCALILTGSCDRPAHGCTSDALQA